MSTNNDQEYTVIPDSYIDAQRGMQNAIEHSRGHVRRAVVGGLGGAVAGAGAGVGLGNAYGLLRAIKNRKSPRLGRFSPFNLHPAFFGGVVGAATGSSIGEAKANLDSARRRGVDPTFWGLGKPRFTAEAAEKYLPQDDEKTAAVGKLVPSSYYGTYSKIKEPLVDRVRRLIGSLGAGWRAAGKAVDSSALPLGGKKARGPIFWSTAQPRIDAGVRLLTGNMPSAEHVPFAGRLGGAARLLAPHAALTAGAAVPTAAILHHSLKDDE